MTTFEKVLEVLKNEDFLKDYTYRRRDYSFIQKFDGGWKRICLSHWFKWNTLYIEPSFGIRCDITEKWFDKLSFRRKEDRRDDTIVGFTSRMLGMAMWYEFEYDLSNFKTEYKKLVGCLKQGSAKVFSEYSSLADVYNNRILPCLDGKKKFPEASADWIFGYLTAGRIIDPSRYEELKEALLKHAEWMVSRDEKNVQQYYHRMDEIISYLESLDLEKMMAANGKKVIVRQ